MGRGKVTLEQKVEIKALLEAGLSQRQAAGVVKVSKKCVSNVAQKLKRNLPLTNTPGQGRKRKSTEADDRALLRLCKKDRTKSSQQLSADWILSNGDRLSPPTIRRRLVGMGYRSYTAKKKPLRTVQHRKKRLRFAKDHQCWSKEWNKVIWSDEAHFELFNRKNRSFIRRLQSEVDAPFNFVPRVQGGGGHISVWGCMTGGFRGPLVIYSGKVDGPAYIKIIESVLPMFIHDTFGGVDKDYLFMQDNAPPHRSNFAKKWITENSIKVLEWPPTSPDFNPIENLWDHMDKELRHMKPTNLDELQQMIQEVWSKITNAQCQKLVDSMPRRMAKCIRSSGGSFSQY